MGPSDTSSRRPAPVPVKARRFDPVWLSYCALVAVSSPFWVPYGAWRFLVGKSRKGRTQRMGLGPSLPRSAHPRIWFHGVSVGEVQSLVPVIARLKEIRPEVEVVVSAGTDTGWERAKRLFPDAMQVRYAPVDLPWTVKAALRRVHPDLIVLSESELWPCLLRFGARQCGAVLINGRISDRTFRRASRARSFYTWLLSHLSVAGVQSLVDRDRICALGMDPERVRILGNTKFDRTIPGLAPDERRDLRERLGLGESPVLVAGSTFPGEELILADALRKVRESRPEARMIIAPRDAARAPSILEMLAKRGFRATLRSREEAEPPPDVVVLDTAGELASLYALGELAFVGRSLARGGGQNPIEPMAMGIPLLHGPRMENFRGVVEEASAGGAARAIGDVEELAAAWTAILEDPAVRERMGAAGRKIVSANRGNSLRTARFIADALDGVRPTQDPPASPGA